MKNTLLTASLFAASAVMVSSAQAQTVIVGGALGNGDFQAPTVFDGNGAMNAAPFENVANWFNLAAGEGPNFGATNGLVALEDNGGQGAFISTASVAANDTGFAVTQAGEVFSGSVAINGGFGGGAAFDSTTTAELFAFTTADGIVDADTALADITELGSITQSLADRFTGVFSGEFFTATADNIGQTVFIGVRLLDTEGAAPFPRIDNVTFTVDVVPEPASLALVGCGLGCMMLRRKRTA